MRAAADERRTTSGLAGARQASGVAKGEWQSLGRLANEESVEQGRHRGRHPAGRRVATDADLAAVREIAQRWIVAFARTV